MTKDSKLSVKKTNPAIYYLARFLVVSPFFHLYFRGKVENVENVPREGKLMIVSNHASIFDPPILASAIPRRISFMAKQELFNSRLFGQLISFLGAYPVSRGEGDRNAIRQALARIEQEWATCVFIEGTRTADGRVYNPKLGAALIAAKSQASILPVCLCGTENILVDSKKLPQPASVTIKIGDVIAPPASTKKKDLELVTQKCADEINKLHDQV
ncbi:lysophospholipid acyltransferase family protein [Cyanobacterium sp. IPPAS B-1200]|uniref:lysophospholipid acyltransferase family protein n=1 Tax=Cyanobacterium sp. IPPAS B-1200 TaxID=1562720 RepID=UPI0008524FAE|nr:lysophospholipid acyltransferase family protein [Cyanobacterium sp. IPPAS B-1200]OEJ79262.1 acyl-phosphate glycerol 3-phosphate acyltransferase [Cyanobacterium sp. IPPAS B-1200]